ncbi:Protein of unknown function [Duganella sp. CF458]|uniref:DUF2987 domain-containing protein n=1 Tax=Duganella sp. CF458 TaxID=1884368 RepID=UPI0008EEE773|nr:DUF2987 domain-containing protein [Duganella sp. CF458]SFF81792.1 Protein of unknown function [Duganella sp. CF458]
MKKLLLIALLASAGAAHAEEREWTTYKKFVESIRLDRFYALPASERDKLDFYLTVEPSNKKLKVADMNLTVVHAGMRSALPLDNKAHLRMVPNPQWLAEDAKIMTTQAKGEKISVIYNLDAVVPEGTQWPYKQLMGSVAQGNAAIGKVAGAFSWFAPTMKSVLLTFDKPSQLTIQSRNGTKRFLSDAKHKIRLPADAELLKENPLVEISTRPLQAELDSE